MGTRALIDVCALSPWTCDPCASGMHVTQSTRAHGNIYGKTLKWENLRGWYPNDHSRENLRGCLTPSRFVLQETCRITYSAKIHRKIFAIECKIVKTATWLFSRIRYNYYINYSNSSWTVIQYQKVQFFFKSTALKIFQAMGLLSVHRVM